MLILKKNNYICNLNVIRCFVVSLSVTILPGVTIGNNVTIGAGSVVTRDIPSNCIAVGNPAKPIKRIEV